MSKMAQEKWVTFWHFTWKNIQRRWNDQCPTNSQTEEKASPSFMAIPLASKQKFSPFKSPLTKIKIPKSPAVGKSPMMKRFKVTSNRAKVSPSFIAIPLAGKRNFLPFKSPLTKIKILMLPAVRKSPITKRLKVTSARALQHLIKIYHLPCGSRVMSIFTKWSQTDGRTHTLIIMHFYTDRVSGSCNNTTLCTVKMLLISDIRVEYMDYKMGNHCFVVFLIFTESLEKTKDELCRGRKSSCTCYSWKTEGVCDKEKVFHKWKWEEHTHSLSLCLSLCLCLSLSLSLSMRGREVQINPVAVLVKLWYPVIVIAANVFFII